MIGIVGPWGSGKTSLLNMICEAVEELDESAVVIRFDPWLFGRTDELVSRFLKELASQFRESGTKRLQDIGNAIASYGERLTPLGWIPFAGGWISRFGKIAQSFQTERDAPSLHAERDKVRALLAGLTSRVIVVVDDIDRLEPEQIRDVVKLVKLVGDFPNVTYLMAYDGAIVARALGSTTDEGFAYLEKIVQSTHHLPEMDTASLRRLFLNELQAVADRFGAEAPLYEDDWALIYERGIRPLIDTIRDIHRYLSAISVSLQGFGDEVAMADLLGLEAIRVFAPSSYALLPSGVSLLTGERRGDPPSPERRNEEKELVEQIIAVAAPNEDAVAYVVQKLFPLVASYAGGNSVTSDLREARRKRLVRVPDVLRIYLFQRLGETAAPSKTVAELFARLENEDDFIALVTPLDPLVLEDVIDRLEDYAVGAPLPTVALAVTTLMNVRRRLREGGGQGLFELRPEIKLSRVVLRLLERVPHDEDRLAIIEEALPRIEDLSARVELIDDVGHRENIGHRLIPQGQALILVRDLVLQITSAPIEQLRTERDLGTGLLGFLSREAPEAIPGFVDKVSSDDEAFIRFIRSGLGESSSTDLFSGLVRRTTTIPYPWFEKEMGKQRLEEAARAVRERFGRPFVDARDELAIATLESYLSGERHEELTEQSRRSASFDADSLTNISDSSSDAPAEDYLGEEPDADASES